MSNIERRPQPAAQELCQMMLPASRKLRSLHYAAGPATAGTSLVPAVGATARAGMERIEIRLRKEELAALREAAARAGRSVSDLVHEAVRQAVQNTNAGGPGTASRGADRSITFMLAINGVKGAIGD